MHAVNSSNSSTFEACIGVENAAYRKCGTKCILGCRFTPNILDVAVTPNDCENSECVEGCFCKDGYVRLEDKCILPKGCPVRSNKSIEFSTGVPKRIMKPFCGGINTCKPPPPPPPQPSKPCKHCKWNSDWLLLLRYLKDLGQIWNEINRIFFRCRRA